MAYNRINRISEEVKKELYNIVRNEMKDPRLSEIITITKVDVTKDLRYAKVFVSVFGNEEQKASSLKALKSAAGFIRHEISGRIELRYTPEFIFELDNSIEYGMHISALINDINKSNEGKNNE